MSTTVPYWSNMQTWTVSFGFWMSVIASSLCYVGVVDDSDLTASGARTVLSAEMDQASRKSFVQPARRRGRSRLLPAGGLAERSIVLQYPGASIAAQFFRRAPRFQPSLLGATPGTVATVATSVAAMSIVLADLFRDCCCWVYLVPTVARSEKPAP
jgi:hypothetical protein